MDDNMFIFKTGPNLQQFHLLLQFLQDTELHVCHPEFSLGVYLSRLLRGYTFEELATHCVISMQTASTNFKQIRNNTYFHTEKF